MKVKVSWVKSLKVFKPTSISELHFEEIAYRCLKIKLSFWSSNDEDSGSTVFWILWVIEKESAKQRKSWCKQQQIGMSHQKGGRGIFVLCTTGDGISLNEKNSTGEYV